MLYLGHILILLQSLLQIPVHSASELKEDFVAFFFFVLNNLVVETDLPSKENQLDNW